MCVKGGGGGEGNTSGKILKCTPEKDGPGHLPDSGLYRNQNNCMPFRTERSHNFSDRNLYFVGITNFYHLINSNLEQDNRKQSI